MKILVPLDGRPHSQFSVDLLRNTFELDSTQVTLLHVVENVSARDALRDSSGRLESLSREEGLESAKELMDIIDDQLQATGAKVEEVISVGEVFGEIKSAFAVGRYDLGILSPKRRTAKQLFLEGSVSNSLLDLGFSCSLILSRKESRSKDGQVKVVFCYGGTSESLLCLNVLTSSTGGLKKDLKIVLVIPFDAVHNLAYEAAMDKSLLLDSQAFSQEAIALLNERGYEYELVQIEQSFESWLDNYLESNQVSLCCFTRSKLEVLHRPIKGARSELLFKHCPVSSFVYTVPVD